MSGDFIWNRIRVRVARSRAQVAREEDYRKAIGISRVTMFLKLHFAALGGQPVNNRCCKASIESSSAKPDSLASNTVDVQGAGIYPGGSVVLSNPIYGGSATLILSYCRRVYLDGNSLWLRTSRTCRFCVREVELSAVRQFSPAPGAW